MVAGDHVDVVIEKAVYRGLGLARHHGQVVFVPRAFPGDRHRVRIESSTPGYVRGVSEERLQAGPGRRESPCPFFPACGGCAYQELGYDEQVRLKAGVLLESLARAGVPWEREIEVRGSPESGWRTRAEFHLEASGPKLRLGLREEGSHRTVDLERCLQLSAGMNGAFRGLLAALGERPELARAVSDVALAESGDGKCMVASLATTLPPGEASRLGSLLPAVPWLTGLGAVVRQGSASRFLPLGGETAVDTHVLGLRLRSHVRSFFQSNRFLVEDLARAVLELTPPGGPVLDLYAGVGLFTLPIAARGDAAAAIEVSATAVADARVNQERAGLEGVRLHEGDVRESLARLRPVAEERIVLDPPRTGAGPGVVEQITARRPAAVVYVSCDPPTLGRDLRRFESHGYRLEAVRAFDLFPDTFHLETLVRLLPR